MDLFLEHKLIQDKHRGSVGLQKTYIFISYILLNFIFYIGTVICSGALDLLRNSPWLTDSDRTGHNDSFE